MAAALNQFDENFAQELLRKLKFYYGSYLSPAAIKELPLIP